MLERKVNEINPNQVNSNDLMAFTYYAKVERNERGTKLHVKDVDNNQQFFVSGEDLIKSAASADQFHEEEKASKTHIAELLVHSGNRPFTVRFEKADGKERTLRGRLIAPEPLLGRSHVEDLDVDKGKNRMRLVDHRTIKHLIVDGVKYTVK